MQIRAFFCGALTAILAVVMIAEVSAAERQPAGKLLARGQMSPDGKGYRSNRNGWIYVHIEGEPRERGFQHGFLVAPELKEILRNKKFLTYWDTGMGWSFFVDAAEKMFVQFIDEEYLDEMKGIAEGAKAPGRRSPGRRFWRGTAIRS